MHRLNRNPPRIPHYSPTIASKIVRINYNSILYWVRTGLVKASIRYESKVWTPVLFSFDDLVELRFIQTLRDNGATTRRVRKALAVLRKAMKRSPRALYIDASCDDVKAFSSSRDILSELTKQTHLLVVNVTVLHKELAERARKITKAALKEGRLVLRHYGD